MDTSDPEIFFDTEGICNHCRDFDLVAREQWFPNEEGEPLLADILDNIKKVGQPHEYDCILGLSGGVDSSYLPLTMRVLGAPVGLLGRAVLDVFKRHAATAFR